MRRFALLLLPVLAITGCGAAEEQNDMTDGGNVGFELTSSDFQHGQAIPKVHGCDGANQSPALQWSEPPEGTNSFALVVDDPDAPSGTFHHWGASDIPADARSIAAGQSAGKQAVNDVGQSGYMGPCPPKGHGPHHYRFKLYALAVDHLDLPADAKIPRVEEEAQKHQVGMTQLIATYERK